MGGPSVVYPPLIVAPSATGATLSWLLAIYGLQVAGDWLAGRGVDRFGPDRVRVLSLVGAVVSLAVMDFAVRSLPGTALIVLTVGVVVSMLMVPQQHQLYSAASDAPIVAVG